MGYDCVGINYLGDWGTQFGKMIVAYKMWGDRDAINEGGIDKLVELYVKFHQAAEENPALNDEARAEFHKLELGDEEDIALWKWFIEISIAEYKKTYAQLGIEFDSYKGESFYTDKMPAQVQKLRDMDLLKIDDGASIVDLEAYNMPPCLILKRDGSTLYPTRDIAAAVYRKQTYDFDKAIYVTSAGQSLHFAQWFKVVELMQYDWHPTSDVEAAVRDSDIIDCVTLASEPFVKGEWLKAGALVMNMADYEVDYDCIRRSSKIVVDYWDNIKHRMISTVAFMWRDGLVKDEDIHAELGEILNGSKPARENDDEIIYFNAVGAGILDIAVTARCYHNAKKTGKGITLPYWED